jgi:hypothetical protein
MSYTRSLLLACIALPLALTPVASDAGFKRHDRGRVVACYAKPAQPAEYALAGRKIMIRPAWTETRVEPALYEERTERVLVSPARSVWVASDPVFRTVKERVVVRAAYRRWRTVVDAGGNAMRYEIIVPAEYAEVERRVLVSDGGRVKVRQPAVYRTVSRPRLVRAERTRVIRHEAVYRTVHERMLVRSSGGRWRKVCG